MRFFITGHKGFIGSYLKLELSRRGHSWHGIDIKDNGPDLTEPGLFRRALFTACDNGGIDAVIHLAAQPGRVFGEESPADTVRLNVQMTIEVARACGELKVPLVYTSTSEVYGPAADWFPRVDEETRPTPINLYGMTKLWGEQICELYGPDKLVIIRPTMPYGPGMEVGRGRAALPTFIWQAMNNGIIEVHPGAKRSWCYVDDMINGFVTVLENGHNAHLTGNIFNVGRDDDLRTMTDIAVLACETVGAPTSLIDYVDPDPTITPVKNISTQRLRSLGWEPQVSLEDGMQRTYEALKQRSYSDRVST